MNKGFANRMAVKARVKARDAMPDCYNCNHPVDGHVGGKHECRYESDCECQEVEFAPATPGEESLQEDCEPGDIELDKLDY